MDEREVLAHRLDLRHHRRVEGKLIEPTAPRPDQANALLHLHHHRRVGELVGPARIGIEVLLEVHSESECDLVHYLEPELAGVNNRNLATFEVSLETSESLLSRLPETATRLSESGIRTRQDVERLTEAGFDGLLVGEALMRADDPGRELEILRGGDSSESGSAS